MLPARWLWQALEEMGKGGGLGAWACYALSLLAWTGGGGKGGYQEWAGRARLGGPRVVTGPAEPARLAHGATVGTRGMA